MDLRCPHRKFGRLLVASTNEGRVEFMCPSRWCGKRDGVVVLHVFSTKSGELVATSQFRKPRGRV